MTYFFIAMSTIRPNLQQALFKYNLMTGAEEEAPMGWYKDVALLIPVNRRVGLLIAAGATYLKRVAEGEKKKLQLDTTDVSLLLLLLLPMFPPPRPFTPHFPCVLYNMVSYLQALGFTSFSSYRQVLAELRKLMQSFDSDKGSGGSSYHYSDPLLSGMDKTRLEEVMTLDNLLGKLSQ